MEVDITARIWNLFLYVISKKQIEYKPAKSSSKIGPKVC